MKIQIHMYSCSTFHLLVESFRGHFSFTFCSKWLHRESSSGGHSYYMDLTNNDLNPIKQTQGTINIPDAITNLKNEIAGREMYLELKSNQRNIDFPGTMIAG